VGAITRQRRIVKCEQCVAGAKWGVANSSDSQRGTNVHTLHVQDIKVLVCVVPALNQSVSNAAERKQKKRGAGGGRAVWGLGCAHFMQFEMPTSVDGCHFPHLCAVARYALLLSKEKRVHASVYSTWLTMDRWMEWMSADQHSRSRGRGVSNWPTVDIVEVDTALLTR
jgi:hypothetical protein